MNKKNIVSNLKHNWDYISYYANILLKHRVAGSYLGVLWLFINPLMFMMIYSFVVQYIFNNRMENFNVFVFIGLTTWNLISRTIMMGPTTIVRNKSIFEQVYFHKFVYPTIYTLVGLYEFLISNTLILLLMLIANIPFTWHLIEFVPITIVVILFTYGITLIVSHIGVYFFDLSNILDFTLKFIFYLSPIMWSYESVNFKYSYLLQLNPISIIVQSYRDILFYEQSPDYIYLLILLIISIILIKIGYKLISKYEDEYGRVI
ncbi:MAG: ABC transporter permease [Peptostreptococcaceae bacterium]